MNSKIFTPKDPVRKRRFSPQLCGYYQRGICVCPRTFLQKCRVDRFKTRRTSKNGQKCRLAYRIYPSNQEHKLPAANRKNPLPRNDVEREGWEEEELNQSNQKRSDTKLQIHLLC